MNKQLFIFYLLVIVTSSCNEPWRTKNVRTVRYADGTISSIKRYNADGKLHGQAQKFYPTGITDRIVMYQNGLPNGNAYYFYESGALKHHRHWRKGKMNGYVADYFDDTVGIIQNVLHFDDDGHLIFKKTFDSLGNVISEEGRRPHER